MLWVEYGIGFGKRTRMTVIDLFNKNLDKVKSAGSCII